MIFRKKTLAITMTLAAISAATFANPIDRQKAEAIALQYQVDGLTMKLAKSAVRKGAHSAAGNLVGGPTDSTAKDAPYYIFSRGENLGYVIVSGDDCLPEILGYTETGNYDESQLPPALKDMLASWQELVEKAQATKTNTPRPARPMLNAQAESRQSIQPLTTSHWHQSGPYNDLCPNRDDNGAKSMTGCVATAISQILYYWRKDLPDTLLATTPTYGMDGYSHASVTLSIPKGTPIKWDLMLDSYNGAPAEYNEAVATMVYAVGTASHLEYSIEGGTATSGHIEDIPQAISTYFGMNGGWVAYRTNYSQEAWTQLIYDELAKGRPVMYTGVNSSSGGHAVYIDGYQKSNDLMRFNFGWGGQGDGYYTTTLETGMNNFNEYQSCLISAYPKKWNIKASLSCPAHVYANIESPFKVTVENNSTREYSGLYCFLANNANKPTQPSLANSFDDATAIPRGSKGSLTLRAKPTSVGTWYVTITDRNLNVLAQQAIEVEKADAQLSLDRIELLGSTETQESAGIAFTKIYNTRATVNAYVSNTADVAFAGTASLNLYASSDNGKTFEKVNSYSKTNTVIAAHSEECISFSVSNLTAGLLYYAEVSPEWGTSPNVTTIGNAADTRSYFTSAGASDLTAVLTDGVLSFSGHWDATVYSTLVRRSANKTAIAYDLANVTATGIVPDVEYPSANALIYAGVNAQGTNVIVGNRAGRLSLSAGHDLSPDAIIGIDGNAQFDINQEPARWYQTTVPFDCDVPDGILAREVQSHLSSMSGINGKTTNVTKLQGGRSYLIMASSTRRQTLTSTTPGNVMVKYPETNLDQAFIGVFTSTETPSGAKIIKDKDTDRQYFVTANSETVDGMRGYFYDPAMTSSATDFRAFSSILLDPAYLDLAKQIQRMYDALDEMAGIASDKAVAEMTDSIANAERIFSSQSISDATAVRNYASALETWISDFELMAGSNGSIERDMSAQITNPSFELSGTTVKGWTIETGGSATIHKNSNLAYRIVGGDGENFLYSSNGATVSQTLSLAPGRYRLSALLGSDEGNTITLFAGEQETTVPAHAFGKHYLTEAVIDSIQIDETTSLTIGVKAGNWYNADNFRLTLIDDLSTDAISQIPHGSLSSDSNQGIYTISGLPVNAIATPGLYIINGKKVIVR
ncbi:MAG: C10 family peptidase [Bacteroidales bacterium]|nr:C10 family peptidase [Candidatus Liminaster caballi]